MSEKNYPAQESELPASSPLFLILALVASVAGAIAAAYILPAWMPGLSNSLLGASPKGFWFLSRGSAIIAYVLLWFSMAFGVTITNKMARIWPGGPAAYDVHEYFSILGMAFALFHAMILLGDHYINYTLAQVLVPFASLNYKPFWVAMGQLSFYLWGIVTLSFYLRKSLRGKTWRVVHYASYAVFLLALAHGIFSGTDSGSAWAAWMYWISGASLLFLLVYRIAVSISPQRAAQKA